MRNEAFTRYIPISKVSSRIKTELNDYYNHTAEFKDTGIERVDNFTSDVLNYLGVKSNTLSKENYTDVNGKTKIQFKGDLVEPSSRFPSIQGGVLRTESQVKKEIKLQQVSKILETYKITDC